jgi:hypothetical protein
MTTNLPRLELPAAELANWLDKQNPDVWWLVDGDPLLTGNLSFPCPSDVLAKELRRLNRPVLLIPSEDVKRSSGPISSNDLDSLVRKEGDRDERMFLFRWTQFPSYDNWMLIEDKDSARWASGIDDEEKAI